MRLQVITQAGLGFKFLEFLNGTVIGVKMHSAPYQNNLFKKEEIARI